MRDMLELVLTREGYEVRTAQDGPAALMLVREWSPDAVVLDVMMPILDGPGMVLAMRGIPALRDVPIIVMSAVSEAAVEKRIDGHAAFVQKPFRVSRVLELVASVLGKGDSEAGGS